MQDLMGDFLPQIQTPNSDGMSPAVDFARAKFL